MPPSIALLSRFGLCGVDRRQRRPRRRRRCHRRFLRRGRTAKRWEQDRAQCSPSVLSCLTTCTSRPIRPASSAAVEWCRVSQRIRIRTSLLLNRSIRLLARARHSLVSNCASMPRGRGSLAHARKGHRWCATDTDTWGLYMHDSATYMEHTPYVHGRIAVTGKRDFAQYLNTERQHAAHASATIRQAGISPARRLHEHTCLCPWVAITSLIGRHCSFLKSTSAENTVPHSRERQPDERLPSACPAAALGHARHPPDRPHRTLSDILDGTPQSVTSLQRRPFEPWRSIAPTLS